MRLRILMIVTIATLAAFPGVVRSIQGSTRDANANDTIMENVREPKSFAGASNLLMANGLCQVNFDNRTPLMVELYVDGSFRGMLSQWGNTNAFTGAGSTVVYARAVFFDGSALNWGPTTYSCYPGQLIYFRMGP